MTIRVLLADDQELVRAGFRMILETQADIQVVGEAGDGVEAVAATRRLQPEVVLMDIRMPNLDGLQATEQLMAARSGSRVVILTTFDLDEYVYQALAAGRAASCSRTPHPNSSSAPSAWSPPATRCSLRRSPAGSSSSSPGSHLPVAPTRLSGSTAREREVLKLVARGLSNAEIAAELVVSDATVKSHVGHLLAKLQLRDRVQAVVLAYESGLVRPGSR